MRGPYLLIGVSSHRCQHGSKGVEVLAEPGDGIADIEDRLALERRPRGLALAVDPAHHGARGPHGLPRPLDSLV